MEVAKATQHKKLSDTIPLRQLMRYNAQNENLIAKDSVLYHYNRQAINYFNKHNRTAIARGKKLLDALDKLFFKHNGQGYEIGADGNFIFLEGKTLADYEHALRDSKELNEQVTCKFL